MRCLKCGEEKEAIRKHKLICGSVSVDGELDQEFGRHRFTPYSKKELAAMAEAKRKDDEYWEGLAREDEEKAASEKPAA